MAASFYPVAFAAQRVGGTRVDVTNLTPIGAEPHDLELNSDQLDRLLEAKVAFVLGSGFQPAVEKAADRRDGPTVELLPKLVDARGRRSPRRGRAAGSTRTCGSTRSSCRSSSARSSAASPPPIRRAPPSYEKNAQAPPGPALRARRAVPRAPDRLRPRPARHLARGVRVPRDPVRAPAGGRRRPVARRRARPGAPRRARRSSPATRASRPCSPRRRSRRASRRRSPATQAGCAPRCSARSRASRKRERADKADYFTLMDANLGKIATALGCP